jgi:hypothetical protein
MIMTNEKPTTKEPDKPGALSAVAWALTGGLIMGWLAGAWHAWSVHGLATGVLAVLLPPYGAYWAVEQSLSPHEEPALATSAEPRSDEELIDALTAGCNVNEAGFLRSGFSRQQYDEYCLCMARSLVRNLTPEERSFLARENRNSAGYLRKSQQADGFCRASSQYLGGAPLATGPDDAK